MAGSFTFAMIKPDACAAHNIGNILSKIEAAGFTIAKARLFQFSLEKAEKFYAVHKGTEYYDRLIKFTISGKVFAMILEKENAVEALRDLIGSTDPRKAAPGSIRALYGTGLPQNAIHASDSDSNAMIESDFIFGKESSIF
jgi:nucleoside-diphosphate kinase